MSLDMSAWSSGQVESKIWMSDILETKLDITKKYDIICYGGWYGLNAFIILCRNCLKVHSFTNYDIDEHALETSLLINKAWTIGTKKYFVSSEDVNTLDTEKIFSSRNSAFPKIIINTSVESIEGLSWWKNLPSGQVILLQTCTLIGSYSIGPVFRSLEQFQNSFSMEKILYSGVQKYEYLDGTNYERFMILGLKA